MTISDQLAVSFVPSVLRKQYADNPARKIGDALPEDHAALLWIDIVTFSPLCNRLMKNTVYGVEKLTGILNHHYDFVLNTITKYGGHALFFAGDGVMSAWPCDKAGAGQSVHLAAACAHEIIQKRNTPDDKNERLSLHALISAGPWSMTELEGLRGNRLLSFSGEVFSELRLVAKNRAPNQVLISNVALSLLDKTLKRLPVEHEASILEEAPRHPEIPEMIAPELSPGTVEELKSFVPGALTFPLNREKLKWIAEIRPVTVLFVRLPNHSSDASFNLTQLRESVALSKPVVSKYNGLIKQIWFDEKESNMLICFGPPPSVHVDNPERGVRLAFELHRLLKNAGYENSIGVSTGPAYCGILGNDSLRQYTVIGDVVNLSARLAGIKQNEIYCDRETCNAARNAVNFKGPLMERVKGRSEPVFLYVPTGLVTESVKRAGIQPFIGRQDELARLVDTFNRVAAGDRAAVIVEGEIGMGKSMLLEAFKTRQDADIRQVFSGSGDSVERNTPYGAWSDVFAGLLGLEDAGSGKIPPDLQDALLAKYGSRASLLNAVLQTDIPDSEEIRNLTGSQRVQATHEFLREILETEAQKQALAIVIDDAQWLDELSWQLIHTVNAGINRCLIVLSFQKTEGSPQVKGLMEKGAETIVLNPLHEGDQEKLLCARLKVAAISGEVSGMVKRIARGNPFFCLELAGSLLEQGVLVVDNDRCVLAEGIVPDELSLPETVRGAVRRRIDRLRQESQLSLKVGSVVGNRFGRKIVSSIYPIETDRQSVPVYLKEIEQSGFIQETVVDNLEGYFFNNTTTAQVAYEMTLAEQRRHLHRESAEWYEQNFQDNLNPFYVRLAHHWNEAGEKSKAAAYLEKEAIRLFQLGFVKQALDVGLEGVKLLNRPIERDPAAIGAKIGEHTGAIGALMANRSIESLIDHKELEDENTEQIIRMLLEISPFAYQCQQAELFALLTIICLRLTLEKGNGKYAAEVYSMYAILYKSFTGDSAAAFAWSNLALAVDQKNNQTLLSRVSFIHCWFIAPWIEPLRTLFHFPVAGAEAGLQSGDIVFGCFNLSLSVILKSTSGIPLDEVIKTAETNFIRNNQRVMNAAFHLIHEEQVAKAFQGRTADYTSLTDEKYDEIKDIASICNTDLYNQIAYYLVSKLKLNAHFGNWEEATGWGEKSLPLLPAFANQPGQIDLEQFYTLAALYRAAETTEETADYYREAANTGIDKIKAWAQLCPANFLHKALLLEAIRTGFMGQTGNAEQLFAQAAAKARESGFIQDAGLAFEHLARMQSRLGLDHGQALQAAIGAYTEWGAAGKVRYLRSLF